MLVRIHCLGYVDFMKKLSRKEAIEVAKSYVREFNQEVYIMKPLSGFYKNRFRVLCVVTPRDVLLS